MSEQPTSRLLGLPGGPIEISLHRNDGAVNGTTPRSVKVMRFH